MSHLRVLGKRELRAWFRLFAHKRRPGTHHPARRSPPSVFGGYLARFG